MFKISILKAENPFSIWGQVVGGPGEDIQTEQYDDLVNQMNLYYRNITRNPQLLKPASLGKGQMCVVFWWVNKSWCRAMIESVTDDSVFCQCLLVDHGETLVVPSDQIRVVMENFLQLPFKMKRFYLSGIKPTTLQVSVHEEKAKLIPSSHWDSSAILYIHRLVQASTQAEAMLDASEAESTAIYLYLTVSNIKICVNDDLVAKKFAYYTRESAHDSMLNEKDQCPVMWPSSILNQAVFVTPNKPVTQTQHPPVMSHTLDETGACNSLTTACITQRLVTPVSSCEGSFFPCSFLELLEVSLMSYTAALSIANTDILETALILTKHFPIIQRFLEFLNPGSSPQQTAPSVNQHDEDSDCQSEETTPTLKTCTTQEVIFSRTAESAPEESGPAETKETQNSKENLACTWFLEYLNPEPLNPDPDSAADTVIPTRDPESTGILVHSALPIEPCSGLDDAPVTDSLRWVLQRKKCYTLSPADCYSWPVVARGFNTLLISQNADNPLSYLPSLLTHIQLNSIHASLTSSLGPVVVLVCPGWEKAQVLYDLLEESKITQSLHPLIILLGNGKDEAKDVQIPKNCLLLVTTPFSLVRLLSHHCFLFLRLCHLVLDETDQLFTLAPDQMSTILEHFQRVTSSKEQYFYPQQLIAVAKQWTSQMEGLLANHMPHPSIIVTVPEDAALYAGVQQILLTSVESSKISVLLEAIDLNPDIGQKTLIIVDSAQETEDVFEALSNKSAFCLKTHKGLTHLFDSVIEQWRKDIGPGSHVILVTTSDCLKALGIQDATCVIHYSFPSSPRLFGSRLFCMAENFRNLSEPVSSKNHTENSHHLARSVLLISEKNARHVIGILRYLGRTSTPLPPELLSFAKGISVAREEQKIDRPLCSYLKSLGVCRESSKCPNRHRLISQLDQSVLPASGVIEVVPLFIKTASVFYGRIVAREDSSFDTLASEMASYYTDQKPGVREVLEGRFYAVQDNEVFHRVKVLSVPDRGNRLFFSVLVLFIDVGMEKEVKSYQILQLPEQFHSLPAQAVEIIVCRVRPADAEIDWHPKVTQAICQKIQGLHHQARVVLSLGNTIFVDPMVRATQVPGMKTMIYEYNIHTEILNTGMGVSNPEHVNLLKDLYQMSVATSNQQEETSELVNGSTPLGVTKAEEDILAEAFRAAEIGKPSAADPPYLKTHEPLSPLCIMNQSLIPASPVSQAAPAHEHDSVLVCDLDYLLNGQVVTEQTHPKTIDLISPERIISFHPQVQWYQTHDSVMVSVKLQNPENQHCHFYPNRVIYSGTVNGRSYRADLELQADIAADRCCWEMKSNEPVLKLVKQQVGHWERLLRTKNIFVSYDADHIEEEEQHGVPNGSWFVGDTGEDYWCMNSESSSESD
ncbi:putative ATP-dependent RNA helicase TDRD12 [Sphaeramia orbicularis]|uniref:putative ATP-dependent RNA helicase TDRD12 n=1 Tax=Sphaeramia orbicularis TaxID=375764 RepID=UPI00117ED4C0|nr:putative ATP-dependent RNA helicase TDRD12 [Sphaeramia orbicularis]